MKKILISFFTFLLFVSPVFAVANENGNGQEAPQNTPKAVMQAGPAEQQRCDSMTAKVNTINARYNTNQERYTKTFQNIADKVDGFVTRLKANGVDVVLLEQDMVRVREMIQNVNQYYNSFQKGLENSNQFVCGQSQGDYVRELSQAREQLRLTRQEMIQLREFIRTNIRVDLELIKSEIAE